MKYEIGKPTRPIERPVNVWLDRTGAGDVILRATDREGDSWCLLILTTDGRLVRPTGIPASLGFAIGCGGRLLVHDGEGDGDTEARK